MSAEQYSKGRVPPNSMEAEIGVIGSMLLDSDAVSKAIEAKIDAESFYKPAHRIIYKAIFDLYEGTQTIDIVTLTSKLRDMGKLKEVGGPVYITDLINSVPSVSNIDGYARIVKDKAILRSLIAISGQITSECYENPRDVGGLLDRTEQKIFDISQKKVGSSFVYIGGGLMKNTLEQAKQIFQGGRSLTGLPSGFIDLDEKTSGFQPADLIILASRPSVGKTSIALNIAEYLAVEEKIPVAIFSLETSKEALAKRMICSSARVDSHKVWRGYIAESDLYKLTQAETKLSNAPIFIDDTPGISVMDMRVKARRLVAKEKIKFIILDYIQLMSPSGKKRENRTQEVTEMSRSIKALARELGVPIMVLSQLNRMPEQRADHCPQVADLRESGSLEQDADLVLLLYRKEMYKRGDPELKGKAELIIGKQRNGPIGKVDLTFIEEYTRFENCSTREGQNKADDEKVYG